MPDLNFEVERAEPLPYAAAPLLIFKLRIVEAGRRGNADPGRRAALPDPDRADPPPLRSAPNRNGSSTCSASRSAGARRCAACSGPIPASSSRSSPAAPSSTCPCRARSTSTWPRPNTSMPSRMERSRSPLFSGTIFYVD